MSDAENDELIDDLEEDTPDITMMHIGESLDPPEARLYTTEQLHSMEKHPISSPYSFTSLTHTTQLSFTMEPSILTHNTNEVRFFSPLSAFHENENDMLKNAFSLIAIVWPEQKQIKLLDSIYRNFYVPPIVLAISYDANGELTRMCVDGKQRLTSIQKFMDGQVRVLPR